MFLALDAPPLADQTIPDACEHRQVGSIFPAIGKASLNDPKSRSNPSSPPSARGSSPGSSSHSSPSWQTPRGVTKGNWDYVRANQIAGQYDQFLQDDPLTKVDRQIIDRYLPMVNGLESSVDERSDLQAPLVADFGCGTGRTLAPVLKRGYRGLAIDLSIPMLAEFAKKNHQTSAPGTIDSEQLVLINANLCELEGIKDDSVDHAICMFSTLGMIAGAKNRALFLGHVRRILKPGGLFILHAHNVWFQLRSPGGIGWALSSMWSGIRGNGEFGDRTADYRGLRKLFIHSFRKNELGRALADHGLADQTWLGIKPGATTASEKLPVGSSLRLVGWIVVCR